MTAIIDRAERAPCLARRRATLQTKLRACDLDGLIAYGSGRHSFLASNPAWYLAGFRQLGPHMALILPADGEPVAIVTPSWDLMRAKEQVEPVEARAVEPEDFLAAVAAELDARGLRARRLAVAGGVQPRAISDAWPAMLAQPPVPADAIVSDVSRIRDAWSLACVRHATAIAEQGYDEALLIARAGMAEYELAAEIEIKMRERGAEDNFQLLSASQHNRAAHRASSRILADGDVLLGEITPAVEGEYVQICRTAVLGEPMQALRDAFDRLDGALRLAMAAARPGVAVRQIVEIMNAPIVAAGFEPYTKPPYMRTRGHSMALGSMDPEIAPDSDHVLLEGMVLVMHPNQYFPDAGYIMCGEPVVITQNGAQPLTRRMGTLGIIKN